MHLIAQTGIFVGGKIIIWSPWVGVSHSADKRIRQAKYGHGWRVSYSARYCIIDGASKYGEVSYHGCDVNRNDDDDVIASSSVLT